MLWRFFFKCPGVLGMNRHHIDCFLLVLCTLSYIWIGLFLFSVGETLIHTLGKLATVWENKIYSKNQGS